MAKAKKFNENDIKETSNNIDEEKIDNKEGSQDDKGVKIEELEKQLDELNNDYLRARADFENFRKRKEQELVEARDRAIVMFVEDLLPSIDNFEMSLKMTDNKEMFIKGVEMIHKNLNDTLKEHHFEEFVPDVGSDFDPHMHEPVLVEREDAETGKILGVIRKGFLHKEKVVRPARVEVAKQIEDKSSDDKKDN